MELNLVLPNRCALRSCPALANLPVLSPRSRCILERHLVEDYAVTDFLFAHNLSRVHYPKKCTRAHAGLQSQSEEMELDDRLAKTVSLEAYTIKSSIACCQKQMGLGLRQCDHDHDGSGHARACANIYKHLLMGDLYDPQD